MAPVKKKPATWGRRSERGTAGRVRGQLGLEPSPQVAEIQAKGDGDPGSEDREQEGLRVRVSDELVQLPGQVRQRTEKCRDDGDAMDRRERPGSLGGGHGSQVACYR